MNAKTENQVVLSDDDVIALILEGHVNKYEILMRKYNQRLYRICISILHNDDDAEDALQEGYIRAYEQLKKFRRESAFSTWLTRIVINQALKKNKEKLRFVRDSASQSNPIMHTMKDQNTPAREMMRKELKDHLESCIHSLPDRYRTVYMMREIEKMSVTETSECLRISEVNVKTRLNRAKEKLRDKLTEIYGEADVFGFHLARCNRIVETVLRRISA